MKSRFLVGVMLLICVSLASPAAAQEIDAGGQTAAAINATTIRGAELAAMDRLHAAHPEIASYREGSRLTRLYGQAFGSGGDPVATAEAFCQQYAGLFGAAAEDLTPFSRLPDRRHTQPLMYDAQTGAYKFTLVYYSQIRGGLPVFRADLKLLVRNEANYPLVLAASTLRDIGDFVADPILENLEFDPAIAADTGMTRFSAAEKVIWAGVNDQAATPVLAVTFIGENDRTDEGYDPSSTVTRKSAESGLCFTRTYDRFAASGVKT